MNRPATLNKIRDATVLDALNSEHSKPLLTQLITMKGKAMRPTKANLECADVILQRNQLSPYTWKELRQDIALAITIAEREATKKVKRVKGKG